MAKYEMEASIASIFARMVEALENLSKPHIKRPAPNLYNYGECTVTVEEFFLQFERFATSTYGYDLSTHLQVLPNYLTGEAKDIVLAFGPSAHYQTVKECIISDASHRSYMKPVFALADFFEMKRRSHESLCVFSIRLETAAGKLEQVDTSFKKDIVRHMFLEHQ